MSNNEKPVQPAVRLRVGRDRQVARLSGGGNVIEQSENPDYLNVDQTGKDAWDMGQNSVRQKGGADAADMTMASSLELSQGDGNDQAFAFLIDRSTVRQGLGDDELQVAGSRSLTVFQEEGDDRLFVDLPARDMETTAEKKLNGALAKKTVGEVLAGIDDAKTVQEFSFNFGTFDGGPGNDRASVEGDRLMFIPRRDGTIEAWVSSKGQPEGENATFVNYETLTLLGHADKDGRRFGQSYNMKEVAAALKEMGVKMDDGVDASDEEFKKHFAPIRDAGRAKRGGVS